MSVTDQTPFLNTAAGRIDDARRAQILAFIKLGCSRRMAAEMVRCAHTTIGRMADRLPDFAAQLADAESHVDVAALTRIQEASAENKNWRAAAWVLERRHPEEFGRRAPHSYSGDQIMALLGKILAFTLPRVTKDQYTDFMADFAAATHEVEADLKHPDRWRKQAGQDYDQGSKLKTVEYRSPYEHPQWQDPRSFEQLMKLLPHDPKESEKWINTLNHAEFTLLCKEFRRYKSMRDEETPQMLPALQILKQQANEQAAREEAECLRTPEVDRELAASQEAQVAESPDERHAEEQDVATDEAETVVEETAAAAVPEAVASLLPDDEQASQEQAVVEQSESGEASEVFEKRQQAASVQSAESVKPVQLFGPRNAPPTAEEHQAYQEWLDAQYAVLRQNPVFSVMFPPAAANAPADANRAGGAGSLASGAGQARLVEWAEAMSR